MDVTHCRIPGRPSFPATWQRAGGRLDRSDHSGERLIMADEDRLTAIAPTNGANSYAPAPVDLWREPWDAVLTPAFMRRHTPFVDVADMIAHYEESWPAANGRVLDAEMLDAFVRQCTCFPCLNELLRAALHEWTRQYLPA
jgi:hypothetical protein